MSTKLLGDTVGELNDSLTSVILAGLFFTLTVGYVSKRLLKEASDDNLVMQSILNLLSVLYNASL